MRENPMAGAARGAAKGPMSDGPRNVVEVSSDSPGMIEVVTFIVPFPVAQVDGVQGWSLSVTHDPALLDIVGTPTIEGTDAGDAFSGGFERTSVASQRRGGAGEGEEEEAGVVSAVVLSFTQPTVLNPAIAQSVLRTRYVLSTAIGNGSRRSARIAFRNGLRGSGQPVSNSLTLQGATTSPVNLVPLEFRPDGLLDSFLRGDANSDERTDLADLVWILNDLFRGGPSTHCQSASDTNADGQVDVADPVSILQYRFLDGPPLSAPFPDCGERNESFDLPCPGGAPCSAG